MSTYNQNVYIGGGGKHDIRLSLYDYLDWCSCMQQHSFSDTTVLKFKHASQANYCRFVLYMTGSLLPSWFFARWFFKPVNFTQAGYKYYIPFYVTAYFGLLTFLPKLTISRKLYTDLLTDPTQDGALIRRTLRFERPALWQFISKQLQNENYSFPEMNDLLAEEFPASMIR